MVLPPIATRQFYAVSPGLHHKHPNWPSCFPSSSQTIPSPPSNRRDLLENVNQIISLPLFKISKGFPSTHLSLELTNPCLPLPQPCLTLLSNTSHAILCLPQSSHTRLPLLHKFTKFIYIWSFSLSHCLRLECCSQVLYTAAPLHYLMAPCMSSPPLITHLKTPGQESPKSICNICYFSWLFLVSLPETQASWAYEACCSCSPLYPLSPKQCLRKGRVSGNICCMNASVNRYTGIHKNHNYVTKRLSLNPPVLLKPFVLKIIKHPEVLLSKHLDWGRPMAELVPTINNRFHWRQGQQHPCLERSYMFLQFEKGCLCPSSCDISLLMQ